MPANSYDYDNRTGIRPISWEEFHGLCKGLAAAIANFQPQMILPIGRGGYYPGSLMAHMLQVDIYPIRLSRRENDVVRYEHPNWLVEPPQSVKGKRVVIVDEICSTGETLTIAKQKVEELGATVVRSAVLYAHTTGISIPDYIGIITDALLLNPWDREIWKDGKFQFHPEYVKALKKQAIEADEGYLIEAELIRPAKGQALGR